MAKRPFGRFNKIHVKAATVLTRTFFVMGAGGGLSAGVATYTRVISGVVTRVYAGAGGANSAGTAVLARSRAYVASGGGISAGAASLTYQPFGATIYVYGSTGGGVASGVAQTTDTYAYVTWAALEIPMGAQATWPVDHIYIGAGGTVSSGTAIRNRTIVRVGSGGLVPTGTAAHNRTRVRSGSGGGVASGAAMTLFQPIGGGPAAPTVLQATQMVTSSPGDTMDWVNYQNTAGLGCKVNRFQFLRSWFETSPGVYNFTPLTTGLNKCQALGIKLSPILFYGAAPWDGDYSGFAAFAVAGLQWLQTNYPGMTTVVEIWNEPDGSWPVSAANYLTMTSTIRNAIRAVPALNNIKIAGGVTWGMDTPYWTALVNGGILSNIDVVSIHQYNSPESSLNEIATLRSIIGSNTIPIYISEWGAYSSGWTNLLPRMLTVMKSLGIWGASYFVVMDYVDFPSQGLLNSDGSAKTAIDAAWSDWFTRVGDGATYVGRDPLNSVSYSFQFLKSGTPVRVLWATSNTLVLINGSQVILTPTPIYVTGAATVVLDPSAVETLLASVTEDFTVAAQGQPFTYLYRLNNDTGETPLTASTDHWQGPETDCSIGTGGYHQPGINNKVVTRWQAPSNMRVRVQGDLVKYQTGDITAGSDGTNTRIIHRHSTTVTIKHKLDAFLYAGESEPFWLIFDVAAGDYIEFEAGSRGINNWWDAVGYGSTLIYSTPHPLSIDFEHDWSLEQGQPWFYLSRNNDDTGETPMILAPGSLDYWVRSDNFYCSFQYAVDMRPTTSFKAVRRLLLNEAKTVHVTGSWSRYQTGGDGSYVRILHNTTVKASWSAVADTTIRTFDFTFNCAAGDYLDIEVGSGGVQDSFDPIAMYPVITQTGVGDVLVPSPTAGFKLQGSQVQFDEGASPDILDWADAAGIDPTFIRFNFLKPNLTQLSPTTWDFSPLVPALNKMRSLGQQHAACIFYGATAWDGDFVGTAAFALAAAQWEEQNYPGTLAHIEVWNEGDGSWPISAANLAHLTQVIHDAIRSDPALDRIKIAGPAVFGGSDLPYINDVITFGLLNYIDIWSFHHYAEPELLPKYHTIIQFLMNQNAAVKPIYISEWGALIDGEQGWIRVMTIMRSLGIGIASFYPLGNLVNPNTHVITQVGTAFVEWRNQIGDDAVYVGRDTLNSVSYSYRFTKSGATVRHLWATTNTRILVDGSPVTLTTTPIYLSGTHTIALDPTDDVLRAAFRWDFITTAQATPWTYMSRLDNDTGAANMYSPNITEWLAVGNSACLINYLGELQPGGGLKAVLRWTVPSNMNLRVQGSALSTGLCDFRIKHNTTIKFEHLLFHSLNPMDTFSFTVTAVTGDVIDFEAGHVTGGAIQLIETLVYQTAAAVSAQPILFFFSGQSNAYGIGTATDGSDLPTHLRDTQLPYTSNQIKIYKPPVLGGPGFFTLHNAKNNNTAATATSSNWGGEAECSWQLWNDADYTRPIYVAKDSSSATTIQQWLDTLMPAALSQTFGPALTAVNAAGPTPLKWFIWHHGNADIGNAIYDQKLTTLVANVRSTLGLTPAQLPWIVIRASDLWINPDIYLIGHFQILQAKACVAMTNVRLIKNDYPLVDDIHETAASHEAEGAAYKTVIDGTAVFTPSVAGSAESCSVPLNTGNGTIFYTLTASQLGSPEGRWELTGTNAGKFRIHPFTGGLETFDQATLTQSTYNLTATLHNGQPPSGKSVNITVTAPVARNPIISLDTNDAANYTLVGGKYSQMRNQANTSQTWTQGTASLQPLQGSLANGKKCWSVNSDGVLSGPAPVTWWTVNSSTDATVMAWCRPGAGTGQPLLWGIARTTNEVGWGLRYNGATHAWGLQYTLSSNNTSGANYEAGGASPSGSNYILTLVKTAYSCKLYKNGTLIVSVDPVSGMRQKLLITGEGSWGMCLGGVGPLSPHFAGLVGPAYMWDVALADADRVAKEAALTTWAT